mmetsp:Transcript_111468/g.296224  ORF Transcript_111468/g.296224 Transcript_111468/m.296224 type:complete len:226 (+) Transcript_111468:213-890(+)
MRVQNSSKLSLPLASTSTFSNSSSTCSSGTSSPIRGRALRNSSASMSPLWSRSKKRKALRSCLSDCPQKTARQSPQATSSAKPSSRRPLRARPALRISAAPRPRRFAAQAEDSAARVEPVSLATAPRAELTAPTPSSAVERKASKASAAPGRGCRPRTSAENSRRSRWPVSSASTRSKRSSMRSSSTRSPMRRSARLKSAMSMKRVPRMPSRAKSWKALRRSFSD